MSPSNINSFVGDLVQMAKAMETLPQVQLELAEAKGALDNALVHNQNLESNIIGYKQEIEALNSRIRSLEVERDDASFRVLEAEDTANVALEDAKAIRIALDHIFLKLDPPKPEPVKEPEPQAEEQKKENFVTQYGDGSPQAQPVATPAEGQSDVSPTTEHSLNTGEPAGQGSVLEAVHSISDLGQSESSPTVSTGPAETVATWTPAPNTDAGSTSMETSSAEPTPSPYFNKRFIDSPIYISYRDWIEGGGTHDDYYGS